MQQNIEFLRAELGALLGHIGYYVRSDNRKPLPQQWREVRQLWARYHCVPYHYLKHRLYERAAGPDFIDFMPAILIRRFRLHRNPRSHVHMVNDKREAVRILAGTGVRCVETLFSISADGTVLRADGAIVSADAAVQTLRERGGVLFVKPIDSQSGQGTSRINAAEIDAESLGSMRNVVIQPALRNHPTIDAINATALNTVRVTTFVEQGRCTIVAAFLKVARGESAVDNLSQGGIAIGIDLASGALKQTGITQAKHGGHKFTQHPDSGVRFDSITLPWWRQTLELAERAALTFQPHTTLGLDIAVTADGPVFIEANENGTCFSLQEAWGPLGQTHLGQSALAHWLSTRTKRSKPDGAPGASSSS